MNDRQVAGTVAVVLLLVSAASAQEPGLEPLQRALAAGLSEARRMAEKPRPAPRLDGNGILQTEGWKRFPPPDQQTMAWLASRIPGLDTANVRAVPAETVEDVMRRAAQAKVTYLDILSDAAFGRRELYFASAESLNRVHAGYVSGTMPIQGAAEDGKPFQMQALLAGQGRVELLYDRDRFTFKDSDQRFKVDKKGRVSVAILGPGDIGVDGISAYGAPIFCPWARIERMTKESMYKMRVETSCGSRGGNDLPPVRRR